MSKAVQLVLMAVVLVAAIGCGVQKYVGLGDDDQTVYSGPVYPATTTVAVAFQSIQVGKSCRVFAESLVQLPAGMTGKDIENAVLAEAQARGADQVLIGQTRQSEDDAGLRFVYYGPVREYLCAGQCDGWKFGYSLWEKLGQWIPIGYAEWGKADVHFETPMVMQMVLLRCQ